MTVHSHKHESLVICGVDDSPGARRALSVAADLSRRLDARLLLLHVMDVTTPPPASAFAYAKLQGQAMANGERLLERLSDDAGLGSVGRQVTHGSPAVALIDTARSQGADLLVVGTRGRGGLTAAVLGSVSADVATKAPCPVVVVPPG